MASRGASARSSVWWDEEKREWTGHDRPDFEKDKPPDYRPQKGAKGDGCDRRGQAVHPAPRRRGMAVRYQRLKDGPLPTHYEPLETHLGNPLYPEQVTNPAADKKERPDNPYAYPAGDERFPYVLTHVSPDRASHGGRHVAALCRIWRSCSRNCSARSRRSWRPRSGLEHGDLARSPHRAASLRRACW